MLLNQYTEGNTQGIAGINNQLVAEAVGMGFLTSIPSSKIIAESSTTNLFLHPIAVKKLLALSVLTDENVNVTSCYRTLAQQYVLKRNLTSLVANIGRSDHGSGRSLDISNHSDLRGNLESLGFIQTYPSNDPVHFDCEDVPDNRSKTILAFQRLWNRNYSNKIDEDGIVGSGTLKALGNTPINGFTNALVPRYLSLGDSGADVGKVQFKLRLMNMYSGEADGKFGDATKSSVSDYQAKAGVETNGIVDALTYKYLFGRA